MNKYYVENTGQALIESTILYKEVNGVVWMNATSNESAILSGGWILGGRRDIAISNIIAETFWPNICKCSPKE